jgi:hypothetical protein
MITSFIQGGLGNQMFQIAAGYSLALDLETDFYLHDGQHHLPLQGNRIESYKDNILKNIQFTDLSKAPFAPYRYDSIEYKEIPQRDNQALIGYFQSEKYFEHNKDAVKSLFSLPAKDTEENSVSIHIRRGDYLKNPEYHLPLDDNYYREALKAIGDYSKVYVFTDSDLPQGLNTDDFHIIKLATDYDELALMSSCTHNIIANSTFSWWAAYLSKKQGKVIAPSKWFGPKGPSNWIDIYCKDWIVI